MTGERERPGSQSSVASGYSVVPGPSGCGHHPKPNGRQAVSGCRHGLRAQKCSWGRVAAFWSSWARLHGEAGHGSHRRCRALWAPYTPEVRDSHRDVRAWPELATRRGSQRPVKWDNSRCRAAVLKRRPGARAVRGS